MSNKITVLICDDHAVVRKGLASLIDISEDMRVIGEAVDGIEAVECANRLQPDVIIMDLIMPRKDGIAAIAEIKKENREAKILVLTSFSEDNNVFPAIKAGALGYLLKDSPPDELLQAIRDVHKGETSLHPAIARKVINELTQPQQTSSPEFNLTEREIEVLRCLAQGLSNQDISKKLAIKEGTVRIHVGNILNKLQLANRTQAALFALKTGIAELPGKKK